MLKDRVDDLEHEIGALRRLPERVASLASEAAAVAEAVRDLKAAGIRAEESEVRRVTALRNDLQQALKRIDDRFDASAEDRRDVTKALGELTSIVAALSQQPPRRFAAVDWKTVLAVVSGVSIPVAAAIIGTS